MKSAIGLAVLPLVGLAVLPLAWGVEAQAPGDGRGKELADLADVYWKWKVFVNPTFASLKGIRGPHDRRWPRYTVEDLHTRKNVTEYFLEKLSGISPAQLTDQERVSLQMMQDELNNYLEFHGQQSYVFAADFLNGPHKALQLLAENLPLQTEEDFNNLLQRYRAFPQLVSEVKGLLNLGIERNLTHHRASVRHIASQVEKMLEPLTEDHVLLRPFYGDTIPQDTKQQIQSRARRAASALVQPALRELKDYVEGVYMPRCRPDIALSSLPDGEQRYQSLLRYYTSSDMTAKQVHDMGLKEVERIKGEMLKTIEMLGLGNTTVKDFSNFLRSDKKNFFTSPAELLDGYRTILYKDIVPKLPALFKSVPKQNVSIKGDDDPFGILAYYLAGSADSSRPGAFFVNTARFDHQPKYSMKTLTLHEGVPGHHFHFALLQESDLPRFRKYILSNHEFFPSPSLGAFIEGWALYAEFLGEEMGLYNEDLLSRYGRLSYEQLRAVRLVVDTGIHALGWSREKVIGYMHDNLAMSKANIEVEVDRYITIPGQACSYKTGEIKIKELRQKAAAILGEKFDVRDFHQVVLGCAAPLSVLTECVERYIQGKIREIIRN